LVVIWTFIDFCKRKKTLEFEKIKETENARQDEKEKGGKDYCTEI